MNKKIFFIFAFSIILLGINFISAGWYYQENANFTTLSGTWIDGVEVYDGNWGTYGRSYYSNVPAYAEFHYNLSDKYKTSSLWQVRDYGTGDYPTVNLTIPTACWNEYSGSYLRFLAQSYYNVGAVMTYCYGWACYGGGTWIPLRVSATGYPYACSTTPPQGAIVEEAMFWDIIDDTTPPTHGNAIVNETDAGKIALFVLADVNDTIALHPKGQYIFSTNNTGVWVNDSAVNFTTTPQSTSTTKILNSTNVMFLGVRWYLTDNAGNKNNTVIYTLQTTDTVKPTFTTIPANVSMIYPNSSFLSKFVATDNVGVVYYSINDSRFIINQTGFLKNNTYLAVGNYAINVTINDTANNINWTIFNVQVNKSQENCRVLFNETSPLEYQKTFKVWYNCTTISTLKRNGTTITNNSVQSLGISAYNFSMFRTDTQNYSIIYNETQFRIVDTTPPVSTPTMISDGSTYVNNTWTKNNVNVTISAFDAGDNNLTATTLTYYCTDTVNTCNPTTPISSGTTISAEGTTYIRFYSNDTSGNRETPTQFRVIKIDKTSPTFTTIPADAWTNYTQDWSGVTFVFSDALSGMNMTSVNDTRFAINSTGFLDNSSSLAVGRYALNISINDSVNNVNSTIYNITVNRSASKTGLTFNATSPQTYNNLIISTCSIITGTGTEALKMNGTTITSGSTLNLGAGYYFFNCSLNQSTNYTYSENLSYFTINKANPTASLNSNLTWTMNETQLVKINLTELNVGDSDVTYIIYRNGTSIATGETWSPTLGFYSYILNTTGGANYSSNASLDSKNLTVNDVTYPLIAYGTGVQNNTYKNQNFISTNVSVTETNEKNITFYLYFSNYTLANSSVYTDTRRTINWTSLLEGIYYFNVTVFDTTSHSNSTLTYKITLDTTKPLISYNPSSDANQTYRNSNWVFINITASDTNKDSVKLEFDGTNETFTTNTGNYYWENKTVNEGNHSFYAWINDSAGNFNSTSNYTVIIDLTDPSVNILLPLSATYNYNTFLPLNFSISDINLNTCWYNLDDTANITISCLTNTTFNTTETIHTLYLFANDSSGRESTDSVTFTVSLTAPGITLNYPTNNHWWITNNVYFNYTPSSAILDVCQVWMNTTGTWHLNHTDTSPDTDVLNNLSLFIPDGRYIWNVWCNNTGGNSAWADNVSNHTFNIDSTYPLISYGNGVMNNTNTTNNFISVNVSVIETNENTISFGLYTSSGLYNLSSYTDARRTINWTNLPDNTYYFNVTINDLAGNTNSTSTYLIRLDDTPPTITINNPLSQNYGTNNSMTLNYTVTDNLIGVDTCWYYIYFTNGTLVKGTEVLSSCENDTFALPGGDNNFILTLLSKDLLSNTRVSSVTFGIRTNSPAIVLSPVDDSYSPTTLNHYFNFTVSTNSDNISTCQLWANTTGTWHKNQTKTNPFYNGTSNIFNPLNISEGVIIWNVWCNDSFNYSGWALTNNTFTVDLTYPKVNITVINTPNSQTFSFNTSINDTNVGTCRYSIFDSVGSVNGLNSNVSFTCNTLTSATVTTYGTYTLLIFAKDKAGNENSTSKNFTLVSPPVIIIPGRGGGSEITKEIAVNFTVTSINGLSVMDNALAKDSVMPRTKQFLITNKGIDSITVEISCDTEGTKESTRHINICEYVTFSETSFEVPANVQERIIGSVSVMTPENSSLGDIYYFNILGVSKKGGFEEYSKLSVSNRVTFLSYIYKQSYIPLFGEDTKRVYPVGVVAFFIGFLFFLLIFLIFNFLKKPLTGFMLGILAFLVIFITWLVIL